MAKPPPRVPAVSRRTAATWVLHSMTGSGMALPTHVPLTSSDPPLTFVLSPPGGEGGVRGRGRVRGVLPEVGENLRGQALQLLGLVGHLRDRVQDEVAAAGLDEALDLLDALGRRPDEAIPLRQRAEILVVALGEPLHPRGLRRLVILADGDERQVRGLKPLDPAPRGVGGRLDLLNALAVALGGDHVGDPAVAEAGGPLGGPLRAPPRP